MINERGTTGFQDIPVGAEVYTSDGDKLGEVREVRGSSFKINAPMQPDYWLPVSSVGSSAVDRITLNFLKDQLGDFKADEPRVA